MDGDGKAQRPADGELCGLAKRARARTQYGAQISSLPSPSAFRAELKAEYAQLVGEVTVLEREVRDRELLLAAIGSMKEGIVITDPSLHDNPIVWANHRFYTMTGYSEKDTLNRNCASSVHICLFERLTSAQAASCRARTPRATTSSASVTLSSGARPSHLLCETIAKMASPSGTS